MIKASRERKIGKMISDVLVMIGCLAIPVPIFVGENLETTPRRLTLQVTGDLPGDQCGRIGTPNTKPSFQVSLYRTFHDDFDEHPLKNGKWVPHYAGSVVRPESFYAGGDGSDFHRKTEYNGEQQIYVDPIYAGRGAVPLGLDPFSVRHGVLAIAARRIPLPLKAVLFNNEYISGMLTTHKSFSQRYGYFEIRAKMPVGVGVWPAFWLLSNNGGWPPEIDAMEGRGQQPGVLAMTTHWRSPATGLVQTCGFDFVVPDASIKFHDYGVLWTPSQIVHFIDRKPVSETSAPAGFKDPMYMIVNLAMGAKNFAGVGLVNEDSPDVVEFEIDRISAYQIESF
jgi:Glycosyl hydrolases family 16